MSEVRRGFPFNYDQDLVSLETGLDCSAAEDLTQQQFKDECDINTIVRRFNIGGELPQGVRMPSFGDFTGVSNYHEAANAIAEAHEAFDAMPAEVRERFGNDPGAFVAFCEDASNLEEARRMGLVPAAELAAAEAAAPTPEGQPGG